MLKQTSFSSPGVEHRCSARRYEVLLLGVLLLLLASQIISAVGKGKVFIPDTGLSFRLRETRLATPIRPLKQNCLSLRASRIIGQRFFRVFSDTGRNLYIAAWRCGVNPGSLRPLTDLGNSTSKNAAREPWPSQSLRGCGWKISVWTTSCLALQPLNRVGCKEFPQTRHQRS